MSLYVFGLNHHTSPLALREALMVPAGEFPGVLDAFRQMLAAGGDKRAGVTLLQTCNRFEWYVRTLLPAARLRELVLGWMTGRAGESLAPFLAGSVYEHTQEEAVRHLFRVVSSLDSLVVGETEILGQVQAAYEQARQAGVTDKVLGTLFQRAVRTGKEVREKTRIGNGKVSIASVAVDLAETVLRDITGKTAMVIGSGTMSEAALSRLMERGIGQVIVLNRTFERARELASRFRGEAGPLDVLRNHLHRADIIISSTGAPKPILGVDAFQDAMAKRRGAPMLLIDIAVPRDVDPAVGALENVFYYDIDSLESQARLNQQQRIRAISEAERLVEEAVKGFAVWRRGLSAEPVVLALTRHFESARERELCRLRNKLAALPAEQQEMVEQLASRLVATLLHRPLEALKAAASEGDPEALFSAVERLFDLRREEAPEQAGSEDDRPAC